MRNYRNFDIHINNLQSDIYEQPPDEGHTRQAKSVIEWSVDIVKPDTVLDVGCGQGFCRNMFQDRQVHWTGVTLGEDYKKCKEKELNVFPYDATFLEFPDDSFDMIFARHILEHSPFPVITFMEWRRVARFLVLVTPAPMYWGKNGRNHYSVLDRERLWFLMTRAGWWPIHKKIIDTDNPLFMNEYRKEIRGEERKNLRYHGGLEDYEYWYICERGEERID